MIATLETERKLETKTSWTVTGDRENTSANSRLETARKSEMISEITYLLFLRYPATVSFLLFQSGENVFIMGYVTLSFGVLHGLLRTIASLAVGYIYL